jgi:hypothetical protein
LTVPGKLSVTDQSADIPVRVSRPNCVGSPFVREVVVSSKVVAEAAEPNATKRSSPPANREKRLVVFI